MEPLRHLPPTAHFSLRREIIAARRRVAVARTDGDWLRAARELTALRLTAHDLFAGTVAS